MPFPEMTHRRGLGEGQDASEKLCVVRRRVSPQTVYGGHARAWFWRTQLRDELQLL